MSMTPDQLRQLAALAEARKARDLAELEAAVSEDRRLVEAIEEFARLPMRDLESFGENPGPMPYAQTALRMAWADQHIAIARKRRAELAKRIAQLRQVAAQSLGKHEALERLRERAAQDVAERRAARQEREAPPVKPQRD